jgi:hypothetical protein
MERRAFIRNSAVLLAAAGLPGVLRSAEESPLIYLSPLKTDGSLSRCQAEVWFVQDGADMCIVTATDAWRAQAVTRGLTQTQVWVGDVGAWGGGGEYKSLPSLAARAGFVKDPLEHVRILALFGDKYPDEWGTWGPRFKGGLADGSRVMLRYRPA